MEKTVQFLIIIHACFGGIALISGLIPIISKKGNSVHKKSGLIFFYSMVLCGISAMTIAVLPNHESPFLFAVGIFSLYFVLSGKRALNLKNKNPNLTLDRIISITMIIAGFMMILLPVIFTKSINIILAVFAIVGIVFSVRDLILFNNPQQLKKGWLKLHLGKMIGGYISATTAFVVVNEAFPEFYGWFIPGIVGGFVITFWIKKMNKSTSVGNV
ncbi:MAG TPA: hypothetical protein P5514_02000 [Bacteroidales bacterium]|nr:hypothetical protein [Bacteroidales bacterium]HRX95691.1 hypothetical protein [Bacteroidales bacterium]